MVFKKGDIVSVSKSAGSSEKGAHLGIILQADWFNIGMPPSYIVSLISSKVYPELDFRPILKPDNKNCLSALSQVVIDKVQTIKSSQIVSKVGQVDKQQMREIHGCLKAILGL